MRVRMWMVLFDDFTTHNNSMSPMFTAFDVFNASLLVCPYETVASPRETRRQDSRDRPALC